MTTAPVHDTRFQALRQRLQGLRYHQPLGLESAPLCEALLSDLVQSNNALKESREQLDAHARELVTTQGTVHPLRQENGRLLRESNQLHLALIEAGETAATRQRQDAKAIGQLQSKVSEATFVSSQLSKRVQTLEAENQALRQRFDEALQHNGVVLPSGVEVRWHGRKEYMESLEPVEPAAQQPAASGPAAAEPEAASAGGAQAKAEAAQLVRLAEAQVSELQRRLEETSGLLRDAEGELDASLQRTAARDAEIARLLERGGGAGGEAAAGGAAGAPVDAAQQQLQLAFLNQQVDFLNEWRDALDAEANAEREAREAAERKQAEAERVMRASVHELEQLQHKLHAERLAAAQVETHQAAKDDDTRRATEVAERPWRDPRRPTSARRAAAPAAAKPPPPAKAAPATRRAWLAESEAAALRGRLERGGDVATRAARAEAAVVTLQRQLDSARLELQAQARARVAAPTGGA